MNVLTIDTTGDVSQVILNYGSRTSIVERETKGAYVEHLVPMIEELLKENDVSPKDLTKIVVRRGPGSWNGTRVGVATAKVLAYALGVPVVGEPAFEGEDLAMVPVYPDNHEDTLKIKYQSI